MVLRLLVVLTTVSGVCHNHDVTVVATTPRPGQLSLFEQFQAEAPTRSDTQVVEAISRSMLDLVDAAPPVDVAMLASVCGIDRVEQRPQPWAGTLFSRDDRLVASIRATDGLERRRFTLLHEGGHTFLPDFLRVPQHRCKGPRNREEQLCDSAAAAMLFPERAFVADLAAADSGLGGVEGLATAYLGSVQATALRTVSLFASPLMLLVFELAQKPAEAGREGICPPKVRLQWAASQGRWPYTLRDKSVGESSPITAAWSHQAVQCRGEIDELFAQALGTVSISARRYGDHVLALVAP